MTRPLLFSFILGAVAGFTLGLASDDFRARASADEVRTCVDEPDRKAYMARLPGEGHTVEACIRVMRFSDPKWVPALGAPTIAGAGVRGKPGLVQQLDYVRAECRRLAKQLKQRCHTLKHERQPQ
jgi:hypothetical protein